MRPRTVAAAFVIGVAIDVWDRYRCWRDAHDPARHPLGYMQCRRCGKKGADLGAFGLLDDGFLRRKAR